MSSLWARKSASFAAALRGGGSAVATTSSPTTTTANTIASGLSSRIIVRTLAHAVRQRKRLKRYGGDLRQHQQRQRQPQPSSHSTTTARTAATAQQPPRRHHQSANARYLTSIHLLQPTNRKLFCATATATTMPAAPTPAAASTAAETSNTPTQQQQRQQQDDISRLRRAASTKDEAAVLAHVHAILYTHPPPDNDNMQQQGNYINNNNNTRSESAIRRLPTAVVTEMMSALMAVQLPDRALRLWDSCISVPQRTNEIAAAAGGAATAEQKEKEGTRRRSPQQPLLRQHRTTTAALPPAPSRNETVRLATLALRACDDARDWRAALRVLSHLHDMNYEPNASCTSLLLKTLLRARRHATVIRIVEELPRPWSHKTCSALLAALDQAKLGVRAAQVLRHEIHKPSGDDYAAVLSACVRAGNAHALEQAGWVWQQAIGEPRGQQGGRIRLPRRLFTNRLRMLKAMEFKEKGAAAGKQAMECIALMDAHALRVSVYDLLAARDACRAAPGGEIDAMLSQRLESAMEAGAEADNAAQGKVRTPGQVPALAPKNTEGLTYYAVRQTDTNKGDATWTKSQRSSPLKQRPELRSSAAVEVGAVKKLPSSSERPAVRMTRLSIMAKDRPDDLLELLDQMEASSQRLSYWHFHAGLSACLHGRGYGQRSRVLLERMRKSGLKPGESHYYIAMRASIRAGEWKQCLELLGEFERRAGRKPSHRMYKLGLDACARSPEPNAALAIRLYESVAALTRRTNARLLVFCLRIAIITCTNAGDWNGSLQLLQRMVEPHAALHHTDINVRRHARACFFLAIFACTRAERFDLALGLARELEGLGALPSSGFDYEVLLRMYAGAGHADAAMLVLDDMEDAGFQPHVLPIDGGGEAAMEDDDAAAAIYESVSAAEEHERTTLPSDEISGGNETTVIHAIPPSGAAQQDVESEGEEGEETRYWLCSKCKVATVRQKYCCSRCHKVRDEHDINVDLHGEHAAAIPHETQNDNAHVSGLPFAPNISNVEEKRQRTGRSYQDWECHGCKVRNFEWRRLCYRCGSPKLPVGGHHEVPCIGR